MMDGWRKISHSKASLTQNVFSMEQLGVCRQLNGKLKLAFEHRDLLFDPVVRKRKETCS